MKSKLANREKHYQKFYLQLAFLLFATGLFSYHVFFPKLSFLNSTLVFPSYIIIFLTAILFLVFLIVPNLLIKKLFNKAVSKFNFFSIFKILLPELLYSFFLISIFILGFLTAAVKLNSKKIELRNNSLTNIKNNLNSQGLHLQVVKLFSKNSFIVKDRNTHSYLYLKFNKNNLNKTKQLASNFKKLNSQSYLFIKTKNISKSYYSIKSFENKIQNSSWLSKPWLYNSSSKFNKSFSSYLITKYKVIAQIKFFNLQNLVLTIKDNNAHDIRYKIKTAINRYLLQANLTIEQIQIATALLLGDSSSISKESKNLFKDGGILHLLAASGFHLGLLLALVLYLLYILPIPKKTKLLFAFTFGLCYLYVSFAGISLVRALTMYGLYLFALWFDRGRELKNIFALSGILILIFSPLQILDAGFHLSFLALGGILYFAGYFHKALSVIIGSFSARVFSASLAASLFTIPYIILFFGQISIWSLVTNLLAVPLVAVLLPLLLLGLLLSVIHSSIAFPFLFVSGKLINFLKYILVQLSYLPNFHNKLTGSIKVDYSLIFLQILFVFFLLLVIVHFILKTKNPKLKLFKNSFLTILLLFSLFAFYFNIISISNKTNIQESKINSEKYFKVVKINKNSYLAEKKIYYNSGLYLFDIQETKLKNTNTINTIKTLVLLFNNIEKPNIFFLKLENNYWFKQALLLANRIQSNLNKHTLEKFLYKIASNISFSENRTKLRNKLLQNNFIENNILYVNLQLKNNISNSIIQNKFMGANLSTNSIQKMILVLPQTNSIFHKIQTNSLNIQNQIKFYTNEKQKWTPLIKILYPKFKGKLCLLFPSHKISKYIIIKN